MPLLFSSVNSDGMRSYAGTPPHAADYHSIALCHAMTQPTSTLTPWSASSLQSVLLQCLLLRPFRQRNVDRGRRQARMTQRHLHGLQVCASRHMMRRIGWKGGALPHRCATFPPSPLQTGQATCAASGFPTSYSYTPAARWCATWHRWQSNLVCCSNPDWATWPQPFFTRFTFDNRFGW